MHQTTGTYVEDRRIDTCWEEYCVVGQGAIQTILAGKGMKQGVRTHLEMYQALLSLYLQSFFGENKDICLESLCYPGRLTFSLTSLLETMTGMILVRHLM